MAQHQDFGHDHGPTAGHDSDDHHGHSHGHDHSHAPKDFGMAFAVGTALNAAFVLIEAGFGFAANSRARRAAAGHNLSDVVGLLVAWVLVRYRFPGRQLIDALVDLPFALPTAVAGIALTAVYAENGWLGRPLAALGLKVAFTPLGVTVALIFIGLPFVVRTVQPVLVDLEVEIEEAAASLGASRWQTFQRVLLPTLFPAIVTGFALAFARAVGEYGSVIFISGNMPARTEITPLLIMTKLEQFDYAGATAIAVVMLVVSFILLLVINLLQWWSARRYGAL